MQPINRRQFSFRSMMLVLVASVSSLEFSCANLYNDILKYSSVSLQAFGSIVSILAGGGVISLGSGQAIDLVIAMVKAALADVGTAVSAYDAAPATDKATFLGKLSTALSVAMAELQTFWNDLTIPDPQLAQLIQGLLGVILSTLAGFATQLPAPQTSLAARRADGLPRRLPITPMKRSVSQFRKDFNAVLKAHGQSAYCI